MRVAVQSFYARLISGLALHRERTDEGLRGLADGKAVRVASDDPTGHPASMAHRARLVRLAGFGRSAETARTDLQTIESAISGALGALTEARTEALAGASQPFDQANGIRADQVEALRDQLLALANTEQNGRYLFSGTETKTASFDAAGSYFGNATEANAPIDNNEQVGSTMSGQRVFLDGGDLFTALDDLVQALRANDTAAITAAVPALAAGIDHLGEVQAEVGLRLQSIERALDRHADESLSLTRRVSEIEDIDLAAVIVGLQESETASAALSSAATRVLGRSLFDYLG